ncbi:MAG TPA: hypothetical protein VIX37_19455, partial [Candidatus Sulfotelmatobacter sp.]
MYGYVIMPEPVHLLVNGTERSTVAQAWKSLKQGGARRLALRAEEPFERERYYDFNVWSEREFREKVRYLHRNPVKRGFVAKPEDWPWSNVRHYATVRGADRKAPLKLSFHGIAHAKNHTLEVSDDTPTAQFLWLAVPLALILSASAASPTFSKRLAKVQSPNCP